MDEEVTTLREPCPWRILDDCGGAFAMGAIGGSVWHGVKGYRSAPRGLKYRECLNAIKLRAPTVGGNFGIWGAMFSTFDCSFAAMRGKDDPWNAIASGFVTSGLLAVRFGASTALKSAVGGVSWLMDIYTLQGYTCIYHYNINKLFTIYISIRV
eukprot:m.8025 g.8025  ORF g.8025 m.8025 type:complete len:154 (-) comp5354_c0_seq2:267-728(-)